MMKSPWGCADGQDIKTTPKKRVSRVGHFNGSDFFRIWVVGAGIKSCGRDNHRNQGDHAFAS